jgi:DNA-directed RNA polymerase specialized sigma24 family protein
MQTPTNYSSLSSGILDVAVVRTGADSPLAEVSSLVQRTLGGDTAAFEQLIVRYERRVFSLAKKLLGSTEDAQDAAQEVFLRVFKYIHRFDVQKPLEPWLLQMTVNVCRNIGRDRQRRWTTFPPVSNRKWPSPRSHAIRTPA